MELTFEGLVDAAMVMIHCRKGSMLSGTYQKLVVVYCETPMMYCDYQTDNDEHGVP